MNNLNDILVTGDATVREALRAIDRGGAGIALLVDDSRELIATITDGDVRRAILDGVSPDCAVTTLIDRREPAYKCPTVAWNSTEPSELLRVMQARSIMHIPLVDDERKIVDVALLRDLIEQSEPAMSAVVMAGGFGKRLRPLTEDVPKPMLDVGGQPVMERLIERLQRAGIHNINITTHYKPKVITEHFGNGNGNGVDINYIYEHTPLGTAGALSLMDTPDEPVLVVNGDIVTDLNMCSLLAFHKEQKADLTVAVRKYEIQVPYGVVETEGVEVLGLVEKPSLDCFINAGIYLLEPVAYEYVPADQPSDMTDLIARMVDDGRRVVSFPIVEYWVDIGEHADYEQAQRDFTERRIEPCVGAKSACS
jgi:dTDP-glucose pyrophosphorylase/CBS domain-containing protein